NGPWSTNRCPSHLTGHRIVSHTSLGGSICFGEPFSYAPTTSCISGVLSTAAGNQTADPAHSAGTPGRVAAARSTAVRRDPAAGSPAEITTASLGGRRLSDHPLLRYLPHRPRLSS